MKLFLFILLIASYYAQTTFHQLDPNIVQIDPTIQDAFQFGLAEFLEKEMREGKIPTDAYFPSIQLNVASEQAIHDSVNFKFEVTITDQLGQISPGEVVVNYHYPTKTKKLVDYTCYFLQMPAIQHDEEEPDRKEISLREEQDSLAFGIDRILEIGHQQNKIPQNADFKLVQVNNIQKHVLDSEVIHSFDVVLADSQGKMMDATFNVRHLKLFGQREFLEHTYNLRTQQAELDLTNEGKLETVSLRQGSKSSEEDERAEIHTREELDSLIFGIDQLLEIGYRQNKIPQNADFKLIQVNSIQKNQVLDSEEIHSFDVVLADSQGKMMDATFNVLHLQLFGQRKLLNFMYNLHPQQNKESASEKEMQQNYDPKTEMSLETPIESVEGEQESYDKEQLAPELEQESVPQAKPLLFQSSNSTSMKTLLQKITQSEEQNNTSKDGYEFKVEPPLEPYTEEGLDSKKAQIENETDQPNGEDVELEDEDEETEEEVTQRKIDPSSVRNTEHLYNLLEFGSKVVMHVVAKNEHLPSSSFSLKRIITTYERVVSGKTEYEFNIEVIDCRDVVIELIFTASYNPLSGKPNVTSGKYKITDLRFLNKLDKIKKRNVLHE